MKKQSFKKRKQKGGIDTEEKKEGPVVKQENKEEPKPYLIWVHIACVIWTPEVYFEDRNSYSIIKGLDTIDKKRFVLNLT